jgi:hypothetical protein
LSKKLLTWRHNSGFSVHNEVRFQAGDVKGIENIAQYIIRNTFSLAKLSYIARCRHDNRLLPDTVAKLR